MPYQPAYEEEGWLADTREARWVFVLLALELASLVGAWIAVLSADTLATFDSYRGADAPSAVGGLASLLTIVFGLAAVIYAVQQRSLARHRVRRIYELALATAVAGLLVFVLIAVVTA